MTKKKVTIKDDKGKEVEVKIRYKRGIPIIDGVKRKGKK